MEEEGEAEGTEEVKDTMEEIKKTTPQKLPKLFSTENSEEPNGDHVEDNNGVETEEDDEDSAEDSDDDDEFPVARKPISAKRHQKLLEAEKKKVFELCKKDINAIEGQEMDVEM